MKAKHSLITAGTLLALGGILAGCASSNEPAPDPEPAPASTEETQAPEPAEDDTVDTPTVDVDGALQPGDSTSGAALIPFLGLEEQTAVFSHKVVSIEPISADAHAELVKQSESLDGYDMHLIRIESNYVSGPNLEYQSFATNFKPVDANLNEMQEISVIGFDFCEQDHIPSPGDNPETVLNTCVLAAADSGSSKTPAGVMWKQSDTAYSGFDGAPAFILAQ